MTPSIVLNKRIERERKYQCSDHCYYRISNTHPGNAGARNPVRCLKIRKCKNLSGIETPRVERARQYVLQHFCCKNDPSKKNDEDVEEEFKDLINERELLLHEWTLRKGVQDMKRWIEKNKSVNPHAAFKGSLQFSKARIATISIPSLSGSLLSSMDEIFEVIHFVDRKISSSSFENRKKSMLTEALWENREYMEKMHSNLNLN
ncbi:hypothetical protein Sjap_009282 [Stephania japonica]|uniref:Uncharacterized protein n=1 Tax=Stephania japonica TaxID=461633 RepID=A0AAP0JR20_9MAGN